MARDYKMAVKNKERMAVLMDILSNDDRDSHQFINLLNETRSVDDAHSNENKSTRLPTIKVRPENNSIESGQAEIETGLPESTEKMDHRSSAAMDKMDINSFHVLKKSIDLSYDNQSLNSSFLSHEPNKFGERNSHLLPAHKYKSKTKITSQSQISGGRDSLGQPIQIRFGAKSPSMRNHLKYGRFLNKSQQKGKYQSVMASQNYGDPNDSLDENSMTAPSVRLNNRL